MRERYAKLPEVSIWRLVPYAFGALVVLVPLYLINTHGSTKISHFGALLWLLVPPTLAGTIVGWFCISTWAEVPKTMLVLIPAALVMVANFDQSEGAALGWIIYMAATLPCTMLGGIFGWKLQQRTAAERINDNA